MKINFPCRSPCLYRHLFRNFHFFALFLLPRTQDERRRKHIKTQHFSEPWSASATAAKFHFVDRKNLFCLPIELPYTSVFIHTAAVDEGKLEITFDYVQRDFTKRMFKWLLKCTIYVRNQAVGGGSDEQVIKRIFYKNRFCPKIPTHRFQHNKSGVNNSWDYLALSE